MRKSTWVCLKNLENSQNSFANLLLTVRFQVKSSDEHFNSFKPSHVASTCVYLARKMCKISPVWDNKMENLIQVKDQEFQDCVRLFMKLHPHISFENSNESSLEPIKIAPRAQTSIPMDYQE